MDAMMPVSIEEGVRNAKARYWLGVDTGDGDMVRSVLAPDCVLDYRGCCLDPVTGVDYLPAMNITLNGRDSWVSDGLSKAGIVSVHQGHHAEVRRGSDSRAHAIFAFTDRLYMPKGAPFSCLVGYGFYHEDYVLADGRWQIATLRISRIKVEVV